MRLIRTLLIDNYDSYTYNLFQQIAVVNGVPPVVFRNDEISLQAIQALVSKGEVDNIVVSPGPGTPKTEQDVGVSLDIVRDGVGAPVLGVCLGMQALAHANGAAIVCGPEPVHGRLSNIRHTGHRLFEGIPSGPNGGFKVVRYHSLVVNEATLPPHLAAIAWTCGGHQAVRPACSGTCPLPANMPHSSRGVVMALAHARLPLYGVQFHPESVATSYGDALLANFRDMTAAHHGFLLPRELPVTSANGHSHQDRPQQNTATLDVRWTCLKGTLSRDGDDQRIFQTLYGFNGGRDAFWLDSAATDRGRFSYMGGREGLLWRRITYKLPAAGAPSASNCGTVCTEDVSGRTSEVATQWWPYLEQLLCDFTCSCEGEDGRDQLPFDFWGGLVGYLGYELKAECGAPAPFRSTLPDAAFFLADRVIALDHRSGDVYLVVLFDPADAVSTASAEGWRRDRKDQVLQILLQTKPLESTPDCAAAQNGGPNHCASATTGHSCHCANGHSSHAAVEAGLKERRLSNCHAEACGHATTPSKIEPFHLHRTREVYMADVQACKDALYAGESYELCLTTALSRRGAPLKALDLYKILRRVSPAPYAAFLSFGQDGPQVCCSSPERFLRGSRSGELEARPIKGTASRCQDAVADAAAAVALAASEKDQAENLMIVDLLRNDLGRVCQVGSVHVPVLMEVESYAVHSLVSTVRGKRKPDTSIVQCLQATFPGGSMTGAPKLRSMEILDRLEKEARSIYSGSLGFIGFNNAFDLNIVIRTAILHGQQIRIGAGGAVVVQSETEAEYDEMRLKAFALMRAIGEWDGSTGPAVVDERVAFVSGA